ncbi:MAG: PEGA domain-containing protein [Prevotella sp.]|nr:PEGA domain-containing protein [Prevotella sp.]
MKKESNLRLVIATSLLCLFAFTANAQKAVVLPQEYFEVYLQSDPEGAKVYLGNKLIGKTPCRVEIPYKGIIMPGKKKNLSERMHRSAEASSVRLTFVKDGYTQGEEVLRPQITSDNKSYYFDWPKSVIHEFTGKKAVKEKDTTIPKGESQKSVNRERAGKTALERTIIRWYFDSAPQGARIFWRVISSVPDEVKNTNELWLGSTPFEETRSFNIQGLTYENSRDVQIEIKVKRKGYIDQNKRFNVRQAIDQQEISSFFDLVEE